MILGNFCIGFVIYWFVTWFPSYLIDDRGFNLLQVGIYGALPALVAIPTGDGLGATWPTSWLAAA
jgi:hypothetical protein